MSLNIGELFGSLSWRHDKKGADEFDRRYDEAAAKAKKKIEAQLGAAVDDRAFAKYHESLNRAEKRAKEKEAFKAALGADFDPKGFNAYQRALGQAERDAKRAAAPGGGFSELNRAMGDFNRQATFARNVVGQIKWPALITGAGLAAQAASTAAAGVTALGSALAPLSGALAAYPALGSAMAQATGTMRLATVGVGAAIGDLNTKLDASSDAFKKLTPEAQAFAKTVDGMKQPIRDIQRDAQRGLFEGLSKGAESATRNIDVLARGVPRTAKVIGDLAEQAGKLLGSRGFGRDLETQMRRNDTTIRRVGEGGLHLANALRNVTLAAGPLVEWMTRMGLRFTEIVDKETAAARESGKLAGFFRQTQVEMSRVVRIGADLAAAFFNIARAGKPLGDDILVSLVKSAQAFRDWTDSARGQNAIARYFREARPGIFEAGRLIRDIVRDFFQLGRGDQVAPLLRQIRTQLLPALVRVVDSTTRAFGPALINSLTQVLLLLGHMAGSSGPLVQIVTLIGKFAEGMNRLLDRFPQLNSAIVNIAAIGGLVKAFQIAGAITGVTRLIGLLKTARTAAVGVTAAEAAGTAAAGAGVARAGRGAAAAGVGAAAIGAIPTAAVTAGTVVLLNVIKDSDKNARRFASALDVVTRSARGLASRDNLSGLRTLSQSLTDMGRRSGLSGSQIRTLQGVIAEFSKKAQGHLHDVAVAWGRTLPQVQRDTDSTFKTMARTTSGHMHDIRTAVGTNVGIIKQRLGTDTLEGRRAMAHNFQEAAKAVQRAMDAGKISTQTGTREIRRLMVAALKQMGFTGEQADEKLGAGLRHGQVLQSQGERQPGQGLAPRARGGYVNKVKRAVGGWIGRRGMVSGDVVPIGPGAVAAYGEYDAHGPGGERAILNRHQAPIAELALAAGGYPGLDHLPSGRQLPILERAMAPMGGLDRLFQRVTRPHYLAQGGRFASGGPAGYSKAQLAALWVQAGGPANVAQLMAAIALAESGGSPTAHNPSGASGLWQILGNPFPGNAFDPLTNARMAVAKYRTQGLGAWEAYTNGAYRQYLGAGATATPAAGAAFAPVVAPTIRAPRLPGRGGLVALINQGLGITTQAANDKLKSIAETMAPTGGGGGALPAGASPNLQAAEALARQMGLSITSTTGGGHVAGSYHYQGRAFDASNGVNTPQEHAFFKAVASRWGRNITELFFDPEGAIKNGRRIPAIGGHSDHVHVAFGRGGSLLRRFASGGRTHANKLTKTVGGATAGLIRKIRPLQTDRSSEFQALMTRVESADQEYSRWERRFNITDEELVDSDTGQLNVKAIQRKTRELGQLILIRAGMERDLEDARDIAKRLVASYRRIVTALRRSLQHAKGKNRAGIRSYIKQYEPRIAEWQGHAKEASDSLFDARTDLLELRGELREVQRTAPEVRDTGAVDTADTGGVDTGPDATTPDTTTAPPTALDIAAGVHQEVQAYLGQQRDLLTSFASNAYTQRQAFSPSGVFSGSPDLQGAALGALRGFGGGANLAGSLGLGGTGPSVGVLNVNFQQPPDNAPTLVQQLRFQVENGAVG